MLIKNLFLRFVGLSHGGSRKKRPRKAAVVRQPYKPTTKITNMKKTLLLMFALLLAVGGMAQEKKAKKEKTYNE